MNFYRPRLFSFLLLSGIIISNLSCTQVDLFEKTVAIPKHAWSASYHPSFTFTIRDTQALYAPYLVIRHTDRYNYNNIWLLMTVKMPGSDSTRSFRIDKQLGTDAEGWLGTGMDDIYEHRIKLVEEFVNNGISFRQAGEYSFTIEQIMREDPLLQVLNVGLRIEKQP